MDMTSLIVWRSLLIKNSSTEGKNLFKHLSPPLMEAISALPEFALGSTENDFPSEAELDTIHYSWFSPFLRSLPEREIKFFLSALKPQQAKDLKLSLMLSNSIPTTTTLGMHYLQTTLFNAITPPDLVPISCLPPDPLNHLLSLSFEELLSLIDLLCMHDLAVEIRHIIDTSKLKEIYSLLTKPQITFLKTLLHKKEPISFKRMGLLNWEKDHEALDLILTQRGINRIAKALYTRHKSLAWHVSHRLDMERGQLLLSLSTELDHPKAYEILSGQVIELMDALNTLNNG